MSTNPTVPPAGPYVPQPPNKSGALKWILIGIGGFFVIAVVGILAVGMFVVHKAKQAGLDPDLIKRSPGLAIAKMAVAANSNVEMVSANEGRQEITVRDKQTGKVMTVSFEDAKNGKFVFKQDGKEATLTTNSANGTVEVKSDEGTFKLGGAAKLPAWVPDYPGSDPQGAFAAHANDGDSGSFGFKTKDPSDKVLKFYQDQLQSSGLKVTANLTSQNGTSSAGMLTAEDGSNNRTLTVIIGPEGGQTAVSVTYTKKR
ncbi:MAG TPA: hypothetical protein VKX49_29905 [Bryobacteraceae bacterium]|nr:hypothetical protein [Bryobacteraceae bacterium]